MLRHFGLLLFQFDVFSGIPQSKGRLLPPISLIIWIWCDCRQENIVYTFVGKSIKDCFRTSPSLVHRRFLLGPIWHKLHGLQQDAVPLGRMFEPRNPLRGTASFLTGASPRAVCMETVVYALEALAPSGRDLNLHVFLRQLVCENRKHTK